MSVKYTKNIATDFLNGKVVPDKLQNEIQESTITIKCEYINTSGNVCDIWFATSLSVYEENTLETICANHDGIPIDKEEPPINPSKVPYVQNTPRPLGTKTYWTGSGDDPNNVLQIGEGEPFIFYHIEGDESTDLQTRIIDLNCMCNDTYIYRGDIITYNALFDYCTLDIIPRLSTFEVGENTDYWQNTTYYGALIVPPTVLGGPGEGNGNVNITDDILDPNGGLVMMPLNEFMQASSPAFWDAEPDYENFKFKNLTPKPNGDGHFNIFKSEMSFGKYVQQLNLLGSNSRVLESHDKDKIGHGMRIRIRVWTNKAVAGDHTWGMVANLLLYRKFIIDHG